jgi:hypothetical protein
MSVSQEESPSLQGGEDVKHRPMVFVEKADTSMVPVIQQ